MLAGRSLRQTIQLTSAPEDVAHSDATRTIFMMTPHFAIAGLLLLAAGINECSCAGTAATVTESASSPGTLVHLDSREPTGVLVGKLEGETPIERLASLPILYKNAGNPAIQELAIVGQLQTQYAYGSDASGEFGTMDFPDASTWGNIEVRRFRLGLKGRLFEKLTFLNLTDLNPDFSPRFYKRTPETYFTYSQSDGFNLSAGKTELKFNREQEYSSRDFLPFERSALGNMFYGGELTGAWVCGKGIAGGWLYYLGCYSNDRQDEWPDFNGGAMILTKVGFNYTSKTHLDLAEVKVQLLHNTEPGYADSPSCLASPSYSDCISISNQIADGRFGLTAEFLWGDGANGRPDVSGFSVMPTYSFSDKLQWISTLEVAASSEENGVFLPIRYEALSPGAGDKSGDTYFAGYTGLNYYIHGHNLKLMSGVKYSYLDGGAGGGDFDGWTWLAGVRMAF
jgi:phosphate-selective porin OprO/OprP